MSAEAHAEEQLILNALELDSLNEYASGQSFNFMEHIHRLLSGEFYTGSELITALKSSGKEVLGSSSRIFSALLIPSAILLTVKLLIPSGISAQRTTAFLCRLSCIASLTSIFSDMQNTARALTEELTAFSDMLTPALIGAVTLSGAENTATLLRPMTALCVDLIQNLLMKWGIPISSAAAGIAAAGSMSSSIHLEKLHNLLKRLIHWGTGSILAVFTAILTLQGRLQTGRDSFSVRTARYAIENLLPVIGGNVSDSFDSLLAAANVVRNAVGFSGLILLVSLCTLPLTKLLGTSLLLHLTAAIADPLGDSSLTSFAEQLAGSIEMLLIVSAAAALLCGLLTGSCITAVTSIIR